MPACYIQSNTSDSVVPTGLAWEIDYQYKDLCGGSSSSLNLDTQQNHVKIMTKCPYRTRNETVEEKVLGYI